MYLPDTSAFLSCQPCPTMHVPDTSAFLSCQPCPTMHVSCVCVLVLSTLSYPIYSLSCPDMSLIRLHSCLASVSLSCPPSPIRYVPYSVLIVLSLFALVWEPICPYIHEAHVVPIGQFLNTLPFTFPKRAFSKEKREKSLWYLA